jgi:hypothetical protein
MSSFVLTQLDASISLFTSLLQHGARTPRYKRNLQWLIKLRARALTEISTASTTQRDGAQRDAEQGHRNDVEEERDDEDVELLGWRTRLIERAGQDRQKIIKTISLATAPAGSQFPDSGSLQQKESMPDGQIGTLDLGLSNASLPMATLDSMNDVVSPNEEFKPLWTMLISIVLSSLSYTNFGIQCSYRMCLRDLKISLM